MEKLPNAIQRWFHLFGNYPDHLAGQPNKNELLLHLCLIPESRDRRKVIIRRVFPVHHGRAVLDLLLELNREQGTTMVLVTHEQSLAESAGRRILMRDGLVVSQ